MEGNVPWMKLPPFINIMEKSIMQKKQPIRKKREREKEMVDRQNMETRLTSRKKITLLCTLIY